MPRSAMSWLIASSLVLHLTSALHIPIVKRATHTSKFNVLAAAPTDGDDLTTVHDIIYIGNITIGGVEYPVQMDTGSSDLWIRSVSTPSPGVTPSTLKANLSYGLGWAAGQISTAPVEFAGFNIQRQALVDASSANNPALGYGAKGIVGLGFTSLSSVDLTVNTTQNANGSDWGRSLLFNAFAQDTKQPNFMAFALQRESDPTDDVQGSFTIGEYEPTYQNISSTDKIPTWPVHSPSRWNVLLESILLPGSNIPVSTNVSGAPSNRAVALLDTGSSYSYGPDVVVNQLYQSISGARLDSSTGQWIVPCNTEIDMAFQIAGRVFPLHPLDVVVQSLDESGTCVGSFVPQQLAVGAGQFDWLVGVNVLRSMYSVYDFGDFDSNGQMGDPYLQLMSLIDPDSASADFAAARSTTARKGITYTTSDSAVGNAAGGQVTVSDSLAKSLNQIATYIPVILAILALNAVALLTVALVGICWLRKRRNGKGPGGSARALGFLGRRQRTNSRRSTRPMSEMPMAMDDSMLDDTRDRTMSMVDSTFSMPISPSNHVYAPVALRENSGANNINVRQSLNSNLIRDSVMFPAAASSDSFEQSPNNPFGAPRPSFAREQRPSSHLRSASSASGTTGSLVRQNSGDANDATIRPHSVAFPGTAPPLSHRARPSITTTLAPLVDTSPRVSVVRTTSPEGMTNDTPIKTSRTPSPINLSPSRSSLVPTPGAEDGDFVSESPRRASFVRTVSGGSVTLTRPSVVSPSRSPPPPPSQDTLSPPPRSALRPRPEFANNQIDRPHSMAIPHAQVPPVPPIPRVHQQQIWPSRSQGQAQFNPQAVLGAPQPAFARQGSTGAGGNRPQSLAY